MGRKGAGRNAFVKATLSKAKEDDVEDTGDAVGHQDDQTADKIGNGPTAIGKTDVPTAPAAAIGALEHSDSETKGQMVQRHKRELKIHKEAIKKLGKKRKDEIEKLDKEISERHAEELAALDKRLSAENEGGDAGSLQELADALQSTQIADGATKEAGGKQPSRAQRRREAKEREKAEREARIAAEQAGMGDSARAIEERTLAEQLRPLGLKMHEITADGHCLYRAVENQLACNGDSTSVSGGYWGLRAKAAEHMRGHPDDYMPFISQDDEEESGDGDPQKAFEEYCAEVENSAAWGGQLELGALAKVLQRHIAVYSAGMPPVNMGLDFKGDEKGSLQLCYLRHAFGLGEHYNSVVKLQEAEAVEASESS